MYPCLHIYVVTAVSAVLIVNVQMVYSVLNSVWEIVYWCCYTDIKARCDTMANDIIHCLEPHNLRFLVQSMFYVAKNTYLCTYTPDL